MVFDEGKNKIHNSHYIIRFQKATIDMSLGGFALGQFFSKARLLFDSHA